MLFLRKPGKDNPFKCTYVLPDGITHTKGYVKDMEEAQRYHSFQNGSSMPSGVKEEVDGQEERADARRKIDLTKNVDQKPDFLRSNKS